MSIEIRFSDENSYVNEEQQEMMLKLINTAAKVEEITFKSELSITFVDNEEIQQLNKNYRGKDYPTDVLSFPMMEEDEEERPEDEYALLGDIIISIPKTIEQANEYGHSFERELGFLLVHGFLHLIGYDHNDAGKEAEMLSKQAYILAEQGLKR